MRSWFDGSMCSQYSLYSVYKFYTRYTEDMGAAPSQPKVKRQYTRRRKNNNNNNNNNTGPNNTDTYEQKIKKIQKLVCPCVINKTRVEDKKELLEQIRKHISKDNHSSPNPLSLC